jgi:uncharacterized caspase-like protein
MIALRSRLVLALCILATMLACSEAFAEKRVALVIGNAAYQNTARLANPANDAEDVAAALTRVGFEVIFERDVTKRSMEQALARFSRAAHQADVALFYFAGHGLQDRGRNYLMPVDAKLEDEFSLNFEMTRLDDVLTSLGQAQGVKILILDACRRNPLVERLARSTTTRDFYGTRGLARVDATRGMLVAYSTQADQVATDGTGRNSPFTAALVRQIDQPGLEIGALFRRVATDVNRATKGQQLPELSVSLLGEFYFNRADTDAQAWANLRGSDDSGRLREFLKLYPNSPLVIDIRERLTAIERIDRERQAREQAARERAARENAERDRHERERLALEQKAQQALQEQQGQREQQTLEKAERERLAREKQERENPQQSAATAQPETQIAMLPPPNESALGPAPPSGGILVQEIKKELKRIGCYGGPVDDRWSTTATRASIQNFVKYARLPSTPSKPDIGLLDAIRGHSGRLCPLECGPRQVEAGGQCVAKTCPAGATLGRDGNCDRPKERKKIAARPSDDTGKSKDSGRQRSREQCRALAESRNLHGGTAMARDERARFIARCMR